MLRSLCLSLRVHAGRLQPVPGEALQEAQQFSRFALAAYGLQVQRCTPAGGCEPELHALHRERRFGGCCTARPTDVMVFA